MLNQKKNEYDAKIYNGVNELGVGITKITGSYLIAGYRKSDITH